MTPKLSTQKDALRNIIQTLTRINKDSVDVEKATMTCELSNGYEDRSGIEES
jgi:hypothetical protein